MPYPFPDAPEITIRQLLTHTSGLDYPAIGSPEFRAIYAKAGVPMLPVVAGLPSTRRHIFAYTVVLAAVSLAPWYLGFAGNLFGFAALALNARFLWLAGRILREGDKGPAGRTFGYSILYLFLIFAFLVIDQAFGAWFATLLSGATG